MAPTTARRTVDMLVPEGHQVFEVLFQGEHVGSVSPATDDDPLVKHPLLRRRRRRDDLSTGEGRRNAYGVALVDAAGHKIPPDAVYTVDTETPVCQDCRPFLVVRPLP